MSANGYAVSYNGCRAVSDNMPLQDGETLVQQIPPEFLDRIKLDQKKIERDQLLRDTDWTLMADAPLSAAQKTAMATYRQKLRDLPSTPGFPNIPWPTIPELSGAADGNIKAPI